MRIRVFPVVLVALLAGLLALINWSAFTTPTSLNLFFTTVTAPLGMVLLGFIAVMTVLYIASVVYLQSSAMLESRRMNKDLAAQRELADKAEASRFTELREFLTSELSRITSTNDQLRAQMFSRLDDMERRQRQVMEQNANTLSAYIGELEDRMEHRMLHNDMPPRGDYRGNVPRG